MKLQPDEFILKFSELGMVVHDFKASTPEEEADCSQELQGQPDILSKGSYRTARDTQRNSCHKKKRKKSISHFAFTGIYVYAHSLCVYVCSMSVYLCAPQIQPTLTSFLSVILIHHFKTSLLCSSSFIFLCDPLILTRVICETVGFFF